MSFSGKVVLITGASSGIGAATAKHFAKLNASLALTGRNLKNLEQVAAKCRHLSNKEPFIVTADLTNESETKNLLESVICHYESLDVLINNAGISRHGSIEKSSLAQFDEIFNSNVRALYHLTMLTVPHLIAKKGVIVNVSSLTSLRTYSGILAYSMSKAAVDQFTRCVALELASKGVRVNSVNSGVIKTNILNPAGFSASEIEDFFEKAKLKQPFGRLCLPEEVASTISFLASDDSSFSTGVNVSIDGGCV